MSKNQEYQKGKLCERIQRLFLYNSWDEVTPFLSLSNNKESSIGLKKYYENLYTRSESSRIEEDTILFQSNNSVHKYSNKFNPRFTQPLLSKKTFLKILFIFNLEAMFILQIHQL